MWGTINFNPYLVVWQIKVHAKNACTQSQYTCYDCFKRLLTDHFLRLVLHSQLLLQLPLDFIDQIEPIWVVVLSFLNNSGVPWLAQSCHVDTSHLLQHHVRDNIVLIDEVVIVVQLDKNFTSFGDKVSPERQQLLTLAFIEHVCLSKCFENGDVLLDKLKITLLIKGEVANGFDDVC